MERWELTNNDVDRECSDKFILKIDHELVNWELVSSHLGLKSADVADIKYDSSLSVELKRFNVLRKWRSNNLLTGTATGRRALLEPRCNELAKIVCQLLSEGESDNI